MQSLGRPERCQERRLEGSIRVLAREKVGETHMSFCRQAVIHESCRSFLNSYLKDPK